MDKDNDKLLVAKILDKVKLTNTRNCITASDFLNLYEQNLIEEMLLKEKIHNYFLDGGSSNVERKKIFFYPDKLTEEIAKKQSKEFLRIIRIELPKFQMENYTHKEYLGGLMKLGIKREKIGDILVCDTGADIITDKEIAPVLKNDLQNLTRFHKANIEILNIEELKELEPHYKELIVLVSSLRLDCVISEIINESRAKAVNIIEEERVFINFKVCANRSKILQIGDVITVRGKGRFNIAEQIGNTKKGNIRLKILMNI